MENRLFPQFNIKSDFVFKISYEGPSFDGQINLVNLAEELSGLSYCLNEILLISHRNKILGIHPGEYEFVVEPFKKGSFKKKIKLVAKTIEKYPATSNSLLTIALIFVGIGQIIQSNSLGDQNTEITDSFLDKVKIELINDPNFLKEYSKLVYPLSQLNDKVKLINPDNTEYEIGYSEKKVFEELNTEDFEFITEVNETLSGRVTRVDLTATKNAVGLKVNDSGPTIPVSFLDSIKPEELKNLLDKNIEITGVTEKNKIERKHITIYTYKIIPGFEQIALPFN